MYQNQYSNPYPHTYMDDIYTSREFASKIGTFVTILNNVPISGGGIPAGTRVFIHNVVRDAGGNEIVTIVFPQMGPGGCIARATNVFGSSLEAPAPIHQMHGRSGDQY
ncbi:hypothetical protein [Bacillus wiedmannii]|uniref:hypothetical protein n=1 Tax=Bacillus wiedmannii TaxID=1890302 RepID=UPI000BF9A9E2|nr:hypothetical protein [Bacillus wiedmannii]PEU24473.1 hypothetical protein CN532_21895 [Bacillus wiedmannii]